MSDLTSKCPRGLTSPCQWWLRYRLLIYLDFTAESFPPRAETVEFLPVELRYRDIQRQTRRVCSLKSWGLNPEISFEKIEGYCWLKQPDLLKWVTRLIPRAESQISGMIWSSRGMRTENIKLKQYQHSAPKTQSKPKIMGLRNSDLQEEEKKIHCFNRLFLTGKNFKSKLCSKEIKGGRIYPPFIHLIVVGQWCGIRNSVALW